jgi:selenocysteine-specific elongation factor
MEVIVGTAGHIDHGKTALVKALTGVDADRLPEEKRRGITVDLGFAELSIGEVHFGFVDVPGHEKFVKNMLAGASGVDLVVLVVASDEGVMPQTREHFEICRLLGIQQGIIALTKSDLPDPETLELARMDVAELVRGSFLEHEPIISISSRTGDGIDALKRALIDIGSRIVRDDDRQVTRLPIDRSFSVKGFGAVVTGTLASGELLEGSEMELLPEKRKVRVRGLQTHGKSVGRASSGQRVAVNLGGIDHSRVARGMMLSDPEVLQPTQIVDVQVEVLKQAPRPLRTRQRIRVHIGTIEALARVQVLNDSGAIAPGGTDLAQIRLEIPVVAVPGERFIIRSYSPQATIAGGEVIDPLAVKHRRRDLDDVRRSLAALFGAKGDHDRTVEMLVTAAGDSGITFSQIQTRTGLRADVLRSVINQVIENGKILDSNGLFISRGNLEHLSVSLRKKIEEFHRSEPLAKGMPREQARDGLFSFLPNGVFQSAIESLVEDDVIAVDKDILRLASHHAELTPAEAALRDNLTDRYRRAGLEVAKLDEVIAECVSETMFSPQQVRKFFQLLIDAGEITKVTEDFFISSDAIDKLIADLRRAAADSGDRVIDIPKFKEIAGVSRKYAIPLLEYLDREHVTARVGDKRVII